MNSWPPGRVIYERSLEALTGARMTSAITVTALGLAFCSRLIRSLMGWPGLVGAMAVLCLIAGASLIARRSSLEWRGLLPISLLVFVAWCALTIFWSGSQWATLSGVVYQLAFLLLGIFIALTRDPIQILRAVGDVVRFSLLVSLTLEVFAGLLIDMPLPFLGIEANLGSGAPIQGIFGLRNQLGIVALIGLITFVIEIVTRSVTRFTGGYSLVLAAFGLLLTRSPVVFGTAAVVALAAVALVVLRRLPRSSRTWAQRGLLAVVAVALSLSWAFRSQIILLINAGSEFEARYGLWRLVVGYADLKPLEGWGWVGIWRSGLQPYVGINTADGRNHGSALNAFLDVWFQTGIVGLFCFCVLIALTFGRSWSLASTQPGTVLIWPALVLTALLVFSFAESGILVDYGWLLFVICSVVAAHRLSWRRRYNPDEL